VLRRDGRERGALYRFPEQEQLPALIDIVAGQSLFNKKNGKRRLTNK
jgi:hypothetical protein